MFFNLVFILFWISFSKVEASGRGVDISLTFDVPHGTTDCFYEYVDLDKHSGQIMFEFDVMEGEDIDVQVEDPDHNLYFEGERGDDGKLNITVKNSGDLRICFNNEFSLFENKRIVFDLEIPLKKSHQMGPDSEMEMSLDQIESDLDEVISDQTHLFRRELRSNILIRALNSRVMWISVVMTIGLLVVSIGQVLILKRFFRDTGKSSFRAQPSSTPFPQAVSNGGQPNKPNAYGAVVVN